MKEDFPIFLWKYQYFSKNQLTTTQNEEVNIFNPGQQNFDAGPDFAQSRINIDGINWFGHVEVHVKSSHWVLHNHQNDQAYDMVILHVVWEDDAPVRRTDGSLIPTIELKDRVDIELFNRYKYLSQSLEKIPCNYKINQVDKLIIHSMLDKTVMQRLERKADFVINLVKKKFTWEEATYRLLAQNFGFKTNKEAFLRLAESLPLKIIDKHRDNLFQIEALLFGVAGFLKADLADDYFGRLKAEYKFLAHKYRLGTVELNKVEWKFLRMRPGNFPTIRLAQFAQLYHRNKNLFSVFKEVNSWQFFVDNLSINQSEYWRNHYSFGKVSGALVPGLGKESVYNLVINTIVPLKVAFGIIREDQYQIDAAIRLLEELPAEVNKVTKLWGNLEVKVANAFDSQGLMELFDKFCLGNKCLNCNIGISIVKTT
ncbi:DUF2851 family protein [Fulvivirgaceae bacterium BMA12]|uniref:DUF2851 family protein n=1 Tax=Agaribacillus aureus TaxID=3051825 RepID=A0ABT8L3I9_9BACT|nr:DUF2851 family protein [Fulvivirgaceae bacterium BMA12]